MLSASHIENAAFQYWHLVHGSYATNLVINAVNNQDSKLGKDLLLQHSMEPATDVVTEDTRRQNVTPRNISMDKP